MLNKVTIIGNLGGNPDTKTFANGNKVCNFTVATTERWKAKDGEKKERTEWHSVAIFNEKIAEIAQKYLSKGSKVYLEGKLVTRDWDKDGVKYYKTEIVLQGFGCSIVLLDPGKGGDSDSNHPDDRATDRPRQDAPRDDRQKDAFADEKRAEESRRNAKANSSAPKDFKRDLEDSIPF